MKTVLLQLALPGASRYFGELTVDGCREVPGATRGGADPYWVVEGTGAVEPEGILLTCDGLDRRVAQASPWREAELSRRAAEEEPGVEMRHVRLPGDMRVAYLRPAGELEQGFAACPLALALELLFPGTPGDLDVAVLEIGPEGRPDILLMSGRDGDGRIDSSTLQIWIHPQDSTANIAREFAHRGGFSLPGVALVRRQADLISLAGSLPTYPRARVFLGRTADQWSGLFARGLAFACLVSLLPAAFAALQLRALRSEERSALAELEASRQRVDHAISDAPALLARAAGVDFASIVAAARMVWRPGSVVQASAHADARSLLVRWKVPREAFLAASTGAGPGLASHGGAPDAQDTTRFAREISSLWSGEVPAGFVRSQAVLSGDGDEIAISFESRDPVARAAVRALD